MKHIAKLLIAASGAALLVHTAVIADHHGDKKMDATKQHGAISVLESILKSETRKDDMSRDIFRHPAETLLFFQVKPGMTVADYMPSSGWYTRVLVPYLGESGQYIGLNPDVTNLPDSWKSNYGDMASKFPAKASGWTATPTERIMAFNSNAVPDDVNGTVDRVLIFREMHNLYRNNILDNELKSIRKLLKDDGMLGIVQHRAKSDAPYSYTDGSKGYLREDDVIKMIETLGFELVGKSEINANANDPANHTNGVWTLPPVYGLKDVDRAKYEAIGESDRMTLLFRKRP